MLGHGTCLRAPMLLLLLLLKRRSSQGCLLSIPCEERRKTFGRVERREHVIHPPIIPPSQRFDDNTCHTFLYSSSDLFRHHTTRAYIFVTEFVSLPSPRVCFTKSFLRSSGGQRAFFLPVCSGETDALSVRNDAVSKRRNAMLTSSIRQSVCVDVQRTAG